MAQPHIKELSEKFQKHEQEQAMSLDEIKNKIMQLRNDQTAIIKDNIFLKRVSITLFLFNIILTTLLLRAMRLKSYKEYD